MNGEIECVHRQMCTALVSMLGFGSLTLRTGARARYCVEWVTGLDEKWIAEADTLSDGLAAAVEQYEAHNGQGG